MASRQENASLMSLTDFFLGTNYEKMICSLFVQIEFNYIYNSIKYYDKDFFSECRSNILSIPSEYYPSFKRGKMTCIKLGFHVTYLALSLYRLKQWFR